ncbi:MAG: arylesterase [Nitrospinae bacterium]|nr:arylesterase [Nitrospinota bacterium]
MKKPMNFHCGKILKALPAIFLGLALLVFVFQPSYVRGDSSPVILALGDSLTAGFGVPAGESYPARLQVILKSRGYPHRVVNAGVSGDTTAGGLRRISWLLRNEPAIVILALGANDGLRGLPVSQMRSNLERIVQICRDRGAKVLLTGMKVPPNFGEDYSGQFERVFSTISKEFKLPFIPFLLEGVAAKRELTQPDGIHPLGPGYAIVADTVWKALEPML